MAVLAASGLALVWAHRPDPGGPALLRAVHRGASALLLPGSWLLVATMVGSRWGASRWAAWIRWVVPSALGAAVAAAAFTGFLLPWEGFQLPTVVVPPNLQGMGVAFDPRIATVDFGGDPISRAVFQRYVLAHVGLAAATVGLVALIARTAARRRPKNPPNPNPPRPTR